MGDLNDPIWNCITLSCCSPAQAEERLAKYIAEHLGETPSPKDVAKLLCGMFDFAEKGTLQPLVQSIARLARG